MIMLLTSEMIIHANFKNDYQIYDFNWIFYHQEHLVRLAVLQQMNYL